MSVYILGRPEVYELAGLDYRKIFRQLISEECSGQVRFVCTELMEQREMECYQKDGIEREKILGVHQYLTGNNKMFSTIKVESKLEELKAVLQFTNTDYRDSEIRVIKDGFVVAMILLDKEDKRCLRAINYYSSAKLFRTEFYMDRVFYVNYYMTASSENGLYAKLARRTFYNRDGSVAYDQIFERGTEWYLFPDGRRYTKSQFIAEFIRRLNLSDRDKIILDASIPWELMQVVFTFGKGAGITAIVHAGCSITKKRNRYESFLKEYPYDWFPYVEMLDRMIVSTEAQKAGLLQELEKYHCRIPDIRVVPVEGGFTYTVLKESYGGNLALSWSFKGKADGFQICDEDGVKIGESRNRYQHYFLIKGYGKEKSFVVKAYVDTANGKVIIAESDPVYVRNRPYEEPLVSLIIPAYSAENYIARTMDNALAQSLSEVEIVVVDDGSTDATPDILDWYNKKYCNVIVIRQNNSGTVAARNAGVEAANGKYIAFMDNDDMIRPDMMERLYMSVQKNNCDIAVTSVCMIIGHDYTERLRYGMKEDTEVPAEEFFESYFMRGEEFGVVIWNKLYRASLIKNHKLPAFPFDDLAWTPYILLYADKICYINGLFYEWDRSIRNSTLLTEWNHYKKEEMYEARKRAVLFYLETGNPKRIGLLKKLTRRYLLNWKSLFSYEKYGKLWEEIAERF